MATWITAEKGIVYREHENRKHGRNKDRYYALSYRHEGKKVFESVGWGSEGVELSEIVKLALELALNRKNGTPPFSFKEMREMRYAALDEAKTEQERAQEAAERERLSQQSLSDFYTSVYAPFLEHSSKTEGQKLNERGLFSTWLKPTIGDIAMKSLTAEHAEAVIRAMQAKGRSPQTQRHARNLLSMIWKLAKERGLCSSSDNPCDSVKLPRIDSARMRFLTRDEAKTLLAALKERSIDTHDISLLSLFSGLRSGEIKKLTWADVNNDFIDVKDPKNGQNRAAFLLPEIKDMLTRRRAEETDHALTNRVFRSCFGADNNPRISRTFARTVDDLGLNTGITDRRQRVVFHTLRHTYASWLVAQGVPLYDVSGLMGHKRQEMTQRYAKHDPAGLKKRAQTLAGILD